MTLAGEGPNSNLQAWLDLFFQHYMVVSLLIGNIFFCKKRGKKRAKGKAWIQYTAKNENEIQKFYL
jgi:hypothetical protein